MNRPIYYNKIVVTNNTKVQFYIYCMEINEKSKCISYLKCIYIYNNIYHIFYKNILENLFVS